VFPIPRRRPARLPKSRLRLKTPATYKAGFAPLVVSNVASRLCDEAKPGQILISPRVLAAMVVAD
jgi:hypothetical protein